MAEPILIPKLQVDLPAEPQVNGQTVTSLLGDDRQQAFDHFKNMFDRANRPAPTLADYKGDMSAYDRARQAYFNNPLAAQSKALKESYLSNVQSQGQKAAEDIYRYDTQQLANNYMNGADRGATDPSIDADRKTAFGYLVNFQFMDAIKAFVMTLPFVATIKKWVQMKMAGEETSWDMASKAVDKENSLKGSAKALGLNPEMLMEDAARPLVNVEPVAPPTQIKTIPAPQTEAPAPKKAEVTVAPAPKATAPKAEAYTPNIELDFNIDGMKKLPSLVKDEVSKLQKAGKITTQLDGKVLATQEAVAELDKIPNIPKDGKSFAKIEASTTSRT